LARIGGYAPRPVSASSQRGSMANRLYSSPWMTNGAQVTGNAVGAVRRLHDGTAVAGGDRVKAVSRARSCGAQRQALTRAQPWTNRKNNSPSGYSGATLAIADSAAPIDTTGRDARITTTFGRSMANSAGPRPGCLGGTIEPILILYYPMAFRRQFDAKITL